MRRKPLALALVALLIVAALLAGCRKSAVPPVDELIPEDEATAAIQEAQENTDQMGSETPAATEESEPTEEPTEAPEPTAEIVETVEPTAEPTATTEPVEEPEPTTAPEPTAEPVEGSGDGATTYVVQPGDNLFRIALRFNTTVTALSQANNITNPAMIYIGQTLEIPAGGSGGGTSYQAPAGQACSSIYVVRSGDNLFRIALRYNYSQAYLAQVNGISNPGIVHVGQEICVP